jgi:hypothetical protein
MEEGWRSRRSEREQRIRPCFRIGNEQLESRVTDHKDHVEDKKGELVQ